MADIIINLKKERVAFVTINREAKANKSLKEGIMKLGGIIMPGLVISSRLMLDMGYKLFDPITGEEVTYDNVHKYPWTMVDGQTRLLTAMEINKDAEAEMAKLAAKRANPDADNEEKEVFSVDIMSAFEYCGPAEKINDLIIILNNTGKAWNTQDYTHNKIATYSDRTFMNVTYKLLKCKFTVSSVSRMIAGKLGVIEKDSIVNYSGKDLKLDSINPCEGIELLHHLLEAGFSKTHLRKRYVWEAYYSISDEYKMRFVNYLAQLEECPETYVDDVKHLIGLKDDITAILDYFDELFPEGTIDFKPKDEILDLSPEALESNLRYIENAYNATKNHSNCKKSNKSKKANSTKKSTVKSVVSSATKSTNTSSFATTKDAVSDLQNEETIYTGPMTSEDIDAVTNNTSETISSNETISDSEYTEIIKIDNDEETAHASTEENSATINETEETTDDSSDELIDETPNDEKLDTILTLSDVVIADEHHAISKDSEDTDLFSEE